MEPPDAKRDAVGSSDHSLVSSLKSRREQKKTYIVVDWSGNRTPIFRGYWSGNWSRPNVSLSVALR